MSWSSFFYGRRLAFAWLASGASLLAGCGPDDGRFCAGDDPPSCYDVSFSASTITIVWPNSDKRMELPLVKLEDRKYYFPNPGGEDKGRVLVTLVDDNTVEIINEKSDGDPIAHVRQ